MKSKINVIKYYFLIIIIIILAPCRISVGANSTIVGDSLDVQLSPPVVCQASVKRDLVTNNTILMGVGSTNIYDTYLSPLEYTGYSLRVISEKMRRTTWFDHKFYKQQIIGLEFSKADNPAGTASEYRLLVDYRLGGHYELMRQNRIRLGVGALGNMNIGAIYNERNGNNPASAQVFANIDLSLIVSYSLNKFALRWQLDSPVMGVLFSPRYGQSYYEISLGNSVGIVNFASLHNQRSLRNYLTIDIPINKYTLRMGYLGSYYQTRVNSIQTHNYTHSFIVGFPIEGILTPRKKAQNNYWK